MDEQGILALITGDNDKEADKIKLLTIKLLFPSLLSVYFLMLKPCRK